MSGWIGERGKAFKAICDVGFVDVVSDGVSANRYSLHEWEEHAGAGISSYLSRRERQRDLMRDRRSGDPEEEKKKKKKKKSVSTLLALTSAESAEPAGAAPALVTFPCSGKPDQDQERTPTRKGNGRVSRFEPSQAFSEFWMAYPKKTGKGQAIKAWPGDDLLPAVLGALEWQVPTWDPKYTKNPATWLNARCWEDEKPQPPLFQKPTKNPSVGHMPASSGYPTKTGRLEMP